MYVIKRNGKREDVKMDKITARIVKLCYGLSSLVDPIVVTLKVVQGLYDGVRTTELDNLAAETAAAMTTKHPDYAKLAARIAVSNLHKSTKKSFSDTVKDLYKYIDPKNGEPAPLVSEEFYKAVKENADVLDAAIIYDRDFNFDYFGFKTLERSYLLKLNSKVAERPQHMIMRVAVGIHGKDIEAAIETYNLMSDKWFTHATPTLFNAGTPKAQMSSCFVAGTKVFTQSGVKNIEEVKIGDLVVTHKGNVKPVVQLHKNPLNDRQIYQVKTLGTPSIQVTGNHRFWSITKEQMGWNEQPQWNSIEQLRKGDYIAIPNKNEFYLPKELDMTQFVPEKFGDVNLNYETDDEFIYPLSVWERKHHLNPSDGAKTIVMHKKHNAIKKKVWIDQEFAFFLGVWIGDGHIVTSTNLAKTKRFVRGIGLTFHKDATALIEKMKEYVLRTFGIEAKISKPTITNTVSLIIHSHIIGRMFKSNYGQGFNHKFLPNYVYEWNYAMIKSFMEGLTTSDGVVTKEGELRITLANEPLVKEIFALCRNVGMAVSYSSSTQIKRGATQLTARISVPRHAIKLDNVMKLYADDRIEKWKDLAAENPRVKVINGQTFLLIMEKEKLDAKPDYVYTLGVQDDHSYVVEGMVCENCFLVQMQDDSIEGIYNTLKQCALISQSAGGIGLSIHNVRASGSYIKGTNGHSNGIIPMIRVFNDTARYVDQGGNKRKGAFAIYLEPWHADIFEFLDLKKNNGKEELRARDLFYALWIPDLFMKRVKEDGNWSLFCPNEAQGLPDTHSAEFEALYLKYEKEGKQRRTVKARELWAKIIESQTETGTPYLLYKDHANSKSNQQNLGTIRSSNLCTEIIEYTSKDETAVCNLASIALSKFVVNGKFDHQKLYEITQIVTRNLNKVIDINYYPVPEAKNSNMRHRPIGIGVQGLADVFVMLRMPFDSEEARVLNKEIFETIYFGALTASKDLAKKDGAYSTFEGSPASKGILQFDMWNVEPSLRWDWYTLKAEIMKYGLRNSLLLAPMPTASTSQILGNNECFEPFTSNIYSRRTLSGEFVIINKYLLEDLIKMGLWNDQMKDRLIAANGSIQSFPDIPQELKDIYKTAWEIKAKTIIDMAADRGAFICQSQSMNIFMENASYAKLSSMHFYAWEKGLKTGIYYLRTKAATDAIQFTVDQTALKQSQKEAVLKTANVENTAHKMETTTMVMEEPSEMTYKACRIDDPDCEACGA